MPPVRVVLFALGLAAAFLFGASSTGSGEPRGVTTLVDYRSSVDDSIQTYGVYVPPGPPPPGGYPVVLHAHGYGWWVGTDFSQWQKDWADAHRWVLVQLNARGPNFYWGIGDVATGEVVDDLAERFGIDRSRVYITGSSMGGTGAFRQGVMNPERIAAAVGVDGWADFREWHWHWYARKDQRDSIEEFRRPLLEAASPLYMAERAMWGDVHVIADMLDEVVLPQQGIDLAARLAELRAATPGFYDSGSTVHPDRGHGGGYDLAWIYDYFLGKSQTPEYGAFRIATTILQHGEMYWGRLERLHYQGQKAILDCAVTQTGDQPVIDVTTTNLEAFTLLLPLSTVADASGVRVFVDGIPAYTGPPTEVTFEAQFDAEDKLAGWEGSPLGDPSSPAGAEKAPVVGSTSSGPWTADAGFRKRPEICGPIGHAFLSPFRVCWGTAGPASLVARHREEALAFASGWNDFMVHGPGVVATPEDDVASWELQSKHLVVFGTLDSSSLLHRAHALHPLPVEVRADRIIVRDPLTCDREYRGMKFGAFVIYPNPLTDGRTYLVACSGRYASQPDGSAPRGLEFDLEKLCWAYPDYVVFNTDLADLPHVMNVNNKPPVTCYEAAYFVEAGYFDANWQPDRLITVDRVRRTRPAGVRLIHVADVTVQPTSLSLPVFGSIDGPPADPPRTPLPRPVLAAAVRVVDEAGQPVQQARVTGYWPGLDADAISRLTLSDGVAYFPYPLPDWPRPVPRFVVLNVMATGAEYDFETDVLRGSLWESDNGDLAIRPRPLRQRLDPELTATVTVDMANTGVAATTVSAALLPPHGRVHQPDTPRRLEPGEQATVQLRWTPDPSRPGGRYRGLVQAKGERGVLQRPVEVEFPVPRQVPVRIVAVSARDLAGPAPYDIRVQLRSLAQEGEVQVRVACSILEARRHLPERQVVLGPGQAVEVVWQPGPEEAPLPRGEYQARITLLGGAHGSEVVGFAVR